MPTIAPGCRSLGTRILRVSFVSTCSGPCSEWQQQSPNSFSPKEESLGSGGGDWQKAAGKDSRVGCSGRVNLVETVLLWQSHMLAQG